MRRAALVLLCLPGLAAAQDQEERDVGLIQGLIEDNLSGVSRTIRIEGFDGALSSEATIELLTIADEQGVWLRAEDLVLDWNRSALLRGRLEVNELSAGLIALPRAPVAEPTAPTPEARGPFSLPELPVSVDVERFGIDRIELGAPFVGEELILSMEGSASLAGGEGEAQLSAERLEAQTGQFEVAGSYSNETDVLGLNLTFIEGEGGIVASRLGLPGAPSLRLTLEGTDPLSDYTADLALATDGQDRVAGQITTAATEGAGRRFAVDIDGDVAPLVAPQFDAFFGDQVSLIASGQQGADGAVTLEQLALETEALRLNGSAAIGPGGWPERFDLTGDLGGTGAPVQLPVAGDPLLVDSADLAVRFDAAEGDRWTADFELRNLERPGLGIETITLTGGGVIVQNETFTAALDYGAEGLVLDDVGASEALGEAVTGALRLEAPSGAPIRVETLSLSGAGLEAGLSAVVQGAESGFATVFDLTADADRLGRFSTLAGRDLSGRAAITAEGTVVPLEGRFDVTVDGQTQDLGIGIAEVDGLIDEAGEIAINAVRDTEGTRLERFEIETPDARITASADLTSEGSVAQIDARIVDLGAVREGLSGAATATGEVRQALDGSVTADLDLTGPGAVTAQVDGVMAPPEQARRIEGTVDISAQDLSLYAPLVDPALAGGVDLRIDGAVTPGTFVFDVDVAGTTADLAVGIDGIDRLLTGNGRLTIEARRDQTGIDLPQFIVDYDLLAANLTGRADEPSEATGPPSLESIERITLDGQLEAADLAVFSEIAGRPLGGAVDLALDLTVEPERLLFAGEIEGTTTDLDVGIPAVGALLDGRGVVALRAQRSATEIVIEELTAEYPDLTVDLTGRATEPGDARIPSLQSIAAADIDGRVAVRNITEIGQALDREMSGSVDLNIDASLRPRQLFFDADILGTTRDLAVGIAQLDPLIGGTGEIVLRAERDADGIDIERMLLQFPGVTLNASGSTTGSGNTARFDLRVPQVGLIDPSVQGPASVVGTASQQPGGNWVIDADASAPGGVSAQADVTVGPEEDGYPVTGEVELAAAQLAAYRNIAGVPLSGSVNATLSGRGLIETGAFDVEVTGRTQSLGIGQEIVDSLLSGTGTLDLSAARRADGTLVLDRVRADFPNVDVTATGSVQGGVSRAEFDARLADLGLLSPDLSGPLTADGTATLLEGGGVDLDVALEGPAGADADVSGRIESGGRLNLRASGAVPLGLANPFIEPRSLAGTASFDVSVLGPPEPSSVSGRITTQDARLALPTFLGALEDIDATIDLVNGQAQITLAADLPAGGDLSLAGPVGLAAPFPADLVITLDEAEIVDPNLYQTSVDGRVTISGPLAGGATIAGDLALGPTEIQVPSSGLGALGDVPDVQHVNLPPDVRATLERAELLGGAEGAEAAGATTARPYPLNVVIRAPSQIFVRGRGLDAELGGQLRVTGTTANIIPQGRFELIRGRLDILGQRFELDEGAITLLGDFVPNLRLVAQTETDTTTISIIVEGPVDDPDVSFSSSPELPEEEVLAQLLFGRGLDNISPLQAVQLASAVATLSGQGGGGLIDDLRSSNGLEDLDIVTTDDGNAAVRAGAYLSENIYTDVTVGSGGNADVALNLDITPSLTAKGTLGSDGNSSVGIFFERDY